MTSLKELQRALAQALVTAEQRRGIGTSSTAVLPWLGMILPWPVFQKLNYSVLVKR